MTREEIVFRANLKYGCGYVLVMLSLLAFVAFLVADPIAWGVAAVVLILFWLRKKIWG